MSTNIISFSSEGRILITSPERTTTVLDTFLAKEYKLFSLDGAELKSKQELLSNLSHVMKFPGYFGGNWDALEECLNDLGWLPANGYVVQLKNADTFINCCPTDFDIFIQIIESVSRSWKKNDIEFVLLVEKNIKDEPD